jgi:hypothetical protein
MAVHKAKKKVKERYVYLQIETLEGTDVEMCETKCGKAAVWEILWSYDPSNTDDLDWKRLCADCVRLEVDIVMQRR